MQKNKLVYTLSYLYLFIPICIFLLAWIKPLISIPLVLFLSYYVFRSIGNMPKLSIKLSGNKTKIIIISIIILLWTWLSGIGGFAWQNIWDPVFRNALFMDLVKYNWPVINTEGESPLLLAYYFGFWLPAALVGKLFNSLEVGYMFQLIWGTLGVFLAFSLISEKIKKVSIWALVIFILFSGLDIIIYILNVRCDVYVVINYLRALEHLELMSLYFNASSTTTLLFWLYNQAIPFWIGFMLILLQPNRKYLVFTYSLLFLQCPFPCVALIPLIIYMEFKDYKWKLEDEQHPVKRFFKTYLTPQNIIGFILALLIVTFFKTNISANQFSLTIFSAKNVWEYSGRLILFLVFEYGVYMYFFKDRIKKDMTFQILFCTMFILSFFKLGMIYDFAWRTAIPSAFFLMLILIEEVPKMNKKSLKFKFFIFIFAIGSITPAVELIRSTSQTITSIQNGSPLRRDELSSAFLPNPCYGNFIGKSDSFFYKYLMNKPKELEEKESKEK